MRLAGKTATSGLEKVKLPTISTLLQNRITFYYYISLFTLTSSTFFNYLDAGKLSVFSTAYLSSTAKLPFSSSAKSVTTEGIFKEMMCSYLHRI